MNLSGRVIEYKHSFRLLFCKILQMQTKFVRKSTLIYGDSPAARIQLFSPSLSSSILSPPPSYLLLSVWLRGRARQWHVPERRPRPLSIQGHEAMFRVSGMPREGSHLQRQIPSLLLQAGWLVYLFTPCTTACFHVLYSIVCLFFIVFICILNEHLFHLCRKCGSKSFKQTSFFRVSIRVMYKWDDDMMNFFCLDWSQERKGPKIGGENLLLRGREEKFLH